MMRNFAIDMCVMFVAGAISVAMIALAIAL
jgi:hypothetical protein